MIRRIPKRGFHNPWAKVVAAVNVGDLEAAFEAGEEVTLESLRGKNLAKGRFDELKILGDGELTKKLKISAHRFSQSALEKIEKAGGEAIVLPGKKPVVKGVAKTEGRGKASASQQILQAAAHRPELARTLVGHDRLELLICAGKDWRGPDSSRIQTALHCTKDGSNHVGKNSRRLHDSRAAQEDPLHARPAGGLSRRLADPAADHRPERRWPTFFKQGDRPGHAVSAGGRVQRHAS